MTGWGLLRWLHRHNPRFVRSKPYVAPDPEKVDAEQRRSELMQRLRALEIEWQAQSRTDAEGRLK